MSHCVCEECTKRRNSRMERLTDDYSDYLDWLDEQPCLRCFEDNVHCVCQLMDEMDETPIPDDQELNSYWRRAWAEVP